MLLARRLNISSVITTITPIAGAFTRRPLAMVHDSNPYLSHIERTATSPRDNGVHLVSLSRIDQVNESIRLLRLRIADQRQGIKFLPGQWLDVHVPGLDKPGGFTITSTPLHARPRQQPLSTDDDGDAYLELAIQRSPTNPPAAWLWRPTHEILNNHLLVRVGGNFVWPPPNVRRGESPPRNVVLIAGGVGINPLISILSHLHLTSSLPRHLHLLYSTKSGPNPSPSESSILFLNRIRDIAAALSQPHNNNTLNVHLHLTGPPTHQHGIEGTDNLRVVHGRITMQDLETVGGETAEERRGTVWYVCGPRRMTDEVVAKVRGLEGVEGGNVLCEKWW